MTLYKDGTDIIINTEPITHQIISTCSRKMNVHFIEDISEIVYTTYQVHQKFILNPSTAPTQAYSHR